MAMASQNNLVGLTSWVRMIYIRLKTYLLKYEDLFHQAHQQPQTFKALHQLTIIQVKLQ